MPTSIGGRLTALVLLYAGVQVAMRLLVGPSLELDEAEAFLHARELAWGYGAQPPLYFWLQWALFQVLGEGLLALALLKALILAATVLALYSFLRDEVGPQAAALGSLSLSLLPQILWEGQRALTHTNLAVLMAVVTALGAVRALRRGRWVDYLLLGVVVGLGVLSKFNYALWPVGLLLATAVLPEWRERLRPLRILAAVGVAVAVVAPAGLWIWRNPELSTASVTKLEMGPGEKGAWLGALGQLGEAVLGFLGLLLVVLAIAGPMGRRIGERLGPALRLVGAGSLLALLALALGVAVTRSQGMQDRWLTPFAWGLAPVGALWLWARFGEVGRRRLIWVVGALWWLALTLLPYASLGNPGWRAADFDPLLARIEAIGGRGRPVQTESQWVAGNLAFFDPGLEPHLLRPGEEPDRGALLLLEEGSSRLVPGAETVAVRRGSRTEAVMIVAPVPR